MLLISLLVLTACADSIGLVKSPEIAKVPTAFSKECPEPVSLPERGLTQLEVETYWATDRTNLADCRDLHKQTVEWVNKRDSGVTNAN